MAQEPAVRKTSLVGLDGGTAASSGRPQSTEGVAPSVSSRFLEHFLLLEDPFTLSPDPRFLYLGKDHSEALAALDLGITERRGLVVLVGEVGTGKTTLANYVASTLSSDIRVALVSNSTLEFDDMLRIVLSQLRPSKPATGRGEMLEALERIARDAERYNGTVVIILDEGQNLSPEVLEQFRQLLNIESTTRKLIQIVLVGQPELQERLQEPELRNLADRIAVRAALNPLSRDEATAYIAHRLERAGGTLEVFDARALKAIVRASHGIPRAINVLCHNAMLFAFGRGAETVDFAIAREAIRERQEPKLRRLRPSAFQRTALLGIGLLLAASIVTAVLWWRSGTPASLPQPAAGPAPATEEAAPPPPVAAAGEAERGRTDAVGVDAVGADAASAGTVEDDAAAASPPATAIAEPEVAEPEAAEPRLDPETATLLQTADGIILVRVESGLNLHDLMLGVYGEYTPELLETVLEANPQIRDPDRLFPGQIVRFPTRP